MDIRLLWWGPGPQLLVFWEASCLCFQPLAVLSQVYPSNRDQGKGEGTISHIEPSPAYKVSFRNQGFPHPSLSGAHYWIEELDAPETEPPASALLP